MNEPQYFRYRMEHAKTKSLRFIGHLDVLRSWERSFRRARLPLAYTLGYHPHPRINIGAALPLGFTSDCELIDFWLERELACDQILHQLRQASHPGFHIHWIRSIDPSTPTLQKGIIASEYTVQIKQDQITRDLQDKVEKVINAEELARTRRGKNYDLRTLIDSLEIRPKDASVSIVMRLTAREGATGRPDEVLRELEIDPFQVIIHRTKLLFQE
jgi:radical SAM-linked protein